MTTTAATIVEPEDPTMVQQVEAGLITAQVATILEVLVQIHHGVEIIQVSSKE